jgi:hypothetical protein
MESLVTGAENLRFGTTCEYQGDLKRSMDASGKPASSGWISTTEEGGDVPQGPQTATGKNSGNVLLTELPKTCGVPRGGFRVTNHFRYLLRV